MEFKSLGQRLRRYKQTAVAAEVGVDGSTVSGWYHDRFAPSEQYWPGLAIFLGLSIDELADIVAQDSKRRSLARISERTVA